MVSSKEESPIFDVKISSIGPGFISGQGAVQELTAMDLAMKLHYLQTVYFFPSPAFEGLTILDLKESMFNWLNHAYVPCGRMRRAESGRPYIKCNDCGVRLFEARCVTGLDEWLETRDGASHRMLVPTQVIGPELGFCPLVLMQITKFKCGGTSVGLSWAHILGDAFSSSTFINLWGKAMVRQYPPQPLNKAQPINEAHNFKNQIKDPLAVKRVDPVGDLWATSNDSKMETFSFNISESELIQLRSKICGGKNNQQIPPFESICTMVWHCIARVRAGPEPVTICKRGPKVSTDGVITNEGQVISVVKPVVEASPMEFGLLIMNQAVDERRNIEEAMENDNGLSDFLIYGANLTFVDLNGVPFYELDVRGHKPIVVSCTIGNIGDKGVVLVLPKPENGKKDHSAETTVNVTLPANQAWEVKSMLKKEWSIA